MDCFSLASLGNVYALGKILKNTKQNQPKKPKQQKWVYVFSGNKGSLSKFLKQNLCRYNNTFVLHKELWETNVSELK